VKLRRQVLWSRRSFSCMARTAQRVFPAPQRLAADLEHLASSHSDRFENAVLMFPPLCAAGRVMEPNAREIWYAAHSRCAFDRRDGRCDEKIGPRHSAL
jgi:hypothetical protein